MAAETWEIEWSKEFAQNIGEHLLRKLAHATYSQIFWSGVIAIVALASAQLWIGVGGVGVILWLTWRWCNNRDKLLWRLDRYRESFRKLLSEASAPEDRAFLQKMHDRILFPLAVLGRADEVSADDLWKIETLYCEYRTGLAHMHIPGDWPKDGYAQVSHEEMLKCELCAAVYHIREHIEGVLSKFEKQVEAVHADLVTVIDSDASQPAILAENFLEKYREWERQNPREQPVEQDEALLKSLCEKDHWTFEQTDRVREICSKQRYFFLESTHDPNRLMFQRLTAAMESVAKQCSFDKEWEFYNEGRYWLLRHQGMINGIRRTFERSKPQTTIRELGYPHMGGLRTGFELEALSNYSWLALR